MILILLDRDPRNPVAPLRKHTSTHSDDITSVQFSPNSSSSAVLLSASTDGLVALSNPNEDNEDEAVLNIGNWGCSVARAGWVENGDGLAWASSDMETLSLWNSEVCDFAVPCSPQLDMPISSLISFTMLIVTVSNIREQTSLGYRTTSLIAKLPPRENL